jgi:hypothetical protein
MLVVPDAEWHLTVTAPLHPPPRPEGRGPHLKTLENSLLQHKQHQQAQLAATALAPARWPGCVNRSAVVQLAPIQKKQPYIWQQHSYNAAI